MSRKMLIDCMFSESDRKAIRLALCGNEAELTAVTIVFGDEAGQLPLEKLKEMAVCDGISAKIVKGAEKPILTTNAAASRAIEGMVLERQKPPYAWDVIYEEAIRSEGKLTVITLGPLTNLAIALFKYEDLPSYIEKIVMLGGSSERGNITPFGEMNVVRDVYACQAVLRSKITIQMLGLDIAERENLEFEGSLAVSAALRPEFFEGNEYYVTVDTALGEMFGRTVIDKRLHSRAEPNVLVVERIEKEKYKNFLKHDLV